MAWGHIPIPKHRKDYHSAERHAATQHYIHAGTSGTSHYLARTHSTHPYFSHAAWKARRDAAVARAKAQRAKGRVSERTSFVLERQDALRRAAIAAAIGKTTTPPFFNPTHVSSVGPASKDDLSAEGRKAVRKATGGQDPFQKNIHFRKGTPEDRYQKAVTAIAKKADQKHRSGLDKAVHEIADLATTPVKPFIHAEQAAEHVVHGEWGAALKEAAKGGASLNPLTAHVPEVKGVPIDPTRASLKLGSKVSQKGLAPALHKVSGSIHTGNVHTNPLAAAARHVGISRGASEKIGKIGVNALKDAIDLPAELIPSAALTIKDPNKVISSFDKTDPLGRLIFHGDLKGIEAHPLVAALEVSGLKGAAGRTAGGAAEIAGAKKLASTKRPPLKLYGNVEGGPKIPRNYSGGPGHVDLIGKAAQKGLEHVKRQMGRDPNVAEHNLIAPKLRLRYQARKRVDDLAHEGVGVHSSDRAGVRQQVDETFTPPTRRLRRAEAAIPKEHEAAVHLAVEKILRRPETLVEDLKTYEAKILSERSRVNLTHEQERLHVRTVKALDKLIRDAKLHKNRKLIFDRAERLIEQSNHLTGELQKRGLLSEEATNAKLVPYAVAHMDAVPSKQFWLESQNGHELTPETVRAHMNAHGVSEPGFISQKEGGRNPYYAPAGGRAYARPMNSAGRTRSGASAALGLHRLGKEPIEESMARAQGDVSQAMSWDEAMSEMGIHKPHVKTKGGKPYVAGRRFFRSYDEAAKAGSDVEVPGLGRLIPVKASRLKIVHDLINGGVFDERTLTNVSQAMREAFSVDHGHQGQYLLIPEKIATRFQEHLQPRGDAVKTLHRIARVWRQSVLSGSVKWLFGNLADVTQRSVMHGLTPADFARGHYIASRLENPAKLGLADEEAQAMRRVAAQVHTNTLGGTLFSAADKSTYNKPLFEAPEGASILRKTPEYAGKAVKKTWNAWASIWFKPERAAERQPQYAALGKLARKEVARNYNSIRGFLKVGGPALDDWVKGLKDTPNQLAAQRYVESVFGRWGKNSPAAKRFLAEQAPFAQWGRVALKYVYYTLPVKHPVKTAILASMNTMTEAERKKLGLDLFAGDNSLPDYLQGSISGKKGLIRAQGYTSFGMMSGFPGSLSSMIQPELMPGLKASTGIDWKNDKLLVDGHEPNAGQRALIAMGLIIGAHIPGSGIFTRLHQGKSLGDVFNLIQPVKHTTPLDIHINQLYTHNDTLTNLLKDWKKSPQAKRDPHTGYWIYTGKGKLLHDEQQKTLRAIGRLRTQRGSPSDAYIPYGQRPPKPKRVKKDPLGIGSSTGLGTSDKSLGLP